MAGRSPIPTTILFAIGLIFLAAAAVSFISTARFLAGATTAQASSADGDQLLRMVSIDRVFCYWRGIRHVEPN
jgi:hypothetical protein